MKYPNVSIIILNWNGWADTIECLESLYKINYPNYEVIIVDNDSKNDSIEKIRDYCAGKIKVYSNFFKDATDNKPINLFEYAITEIENEKFNEIINDSPSNKKLILIKNEKNDGFPGGCNIGMEYAIKKGTDYILLLNNDTVVKNNFLDELVNFAEKDREIGIVGSKIYYYDFPNKLQAAGGKINWFLGKIDTYGADEEDKGKYDKIEERDYVYGTSFLLKKSVLERISYMDTTFFFGVEEYDYCTKAKKAGFKIFYNPKSVIWHKGGASSSKLSEYPETLNFLKKTGGSRLYRYYYLLFKRYGPKYVYFIPFSIFMINSYLKPKLFLILLFRGDFKTIKSGLKRILGIKS